jgi:hypothetical protein
MIELGLKDAIIAVTFGIPGTLDYEIGGMVARHAQVRHEAIDLTQVRLSQELLDRTAHALGMWRWIVDPLCNRLVQWRFGKEATYWSGTHGGLFTGTEALFPDASDTWDLAVRRFALGEEAHFVTSVDLAPPGFDPRSGLPKAPLLDPAILCYDQQINYAIQQLGNMLPLLAPQSYPCRTPFLGPSWVHFNLNLPRRYKEDLYLYKEILKQAYPELYSLPVKNRLGLPLRAPAWRYHLRRAVSFSRVTARRLAPGWRWNVLPGQKYIDTDRALRRREDVRTVVRDNITALDRRGVVDWVDTDALWDDHMRGRANHGYALTLLASLEVFLRNDIPPVPQESLGP